MSVGPAFGVDREEIGSTGLTGAIGAFFEQTLDQIVENQTGKKPLEITQAYERIILKNSMML